jgi:hypothetical protein
MLVVDLDGRREREFAPGQYSSDGGFDSFSPDWQPRTPGVRR